MPNPAHEALLRQGLEEWNQWRALNASVTPDLTGISMSAADLKGADLSHARLRGATLIRARLDGSDLRYADLREARLHEADLTEADLSRANLESAILAGAKLRGARLFGASLRGAQITVVDFRRADLREADLEGADLRESLGAGASFERAHLKDAELFGCRLAECNLSSSEGLDLRQIEAADLDDSTLLPENLMTEASGSVSAIARALRAFRARVTGATVSEGELSSYHALLRKLASKGVPVADAFIEEGELVRPVTSWERTPGGEAFEVSPVRWVDADLLRRKIDAALDAAAREGG